MTRISVTFMCQWKSCEKLYIPFLFFWLLFIFFHVSMKVEYLLARSAACKSFCNINAYMSLQAQKWKSCKKLYIPFYLSGYNSLSFSCIYESRVLASCLCCMYIWASWAPLKSGFWTNIYTLILKKAWKRVSYEILGTYRFAMRYDMLRQWERDSKRHGFAAQQLNSVLPFPAQLKSNSTT